MSLPPGFLDELRTRVSLSHVVGRKVIWDVRRSNQGKGDMWAPCPFHQEKTASFHVDDRKGFYYCFGCHAKGDAVTFVQETENVGFMEAVEILAREAGMPMPARDPQVEKQADRRGQLFEVMEEAVNYYRLQLRSGAGAEARDYLAGRRLSQAAQDRFGIGFAPDARQGVFKALTAKGISPDLIVEAGLCAQPDADAGRGTTPYDRFRGRIIFPIRDARGRAISLGGRAMDPAARAKYLNGPQTLLFDKGRSLYNHGPAREAAGKGQQLIVAEGYMDVIALSEAGFGAAVAPLGTAITEDQLRMMWRIHPEPVIALDGDGAGLRAAQSAVNLALPLIEAGFSLRFAILPAGYDPDDLIRADGPTAFARVLDTAQPMAQLLWQRETDGKVFDSPERRAMLEKTLNAALARIRDPSIRAHYGEEMRRLRAELFAMSKRNGDWRAPGYRDGRKIASGTGAWSNRGFGERMAPGFGAPLAATRASLLASADEGAVEERVREAVILVTLALHPALIARFETALERLDPRLDEHRHVQQTLLACAGLDDPQAAQDMIRTRAGMVLDNLMTQSHVRISPAMMNPGDHEKALKCLAEELAKLTARRAARREVADAEEDLSTLADEGVTWRLAQAAEARNLAERAQMDDANDLGEDRGAMSKHLKSLIDGQVWVKKRS